MAWEIDVHLVLDWALSLDTRSYESLTAALRLLEDLGPSLGRPMVDTIHGSRFRNMKELRPGSSRRSELRVLFAFDPARKAVLLVGGDKSRAWSVWYVKAIRDADELFERHLASFRQDGQKR